VLQNPHAIIVLRMYEATAKNADFFYLRTDIPFEKLNTPYIAREVLRVL